MGEIGYFEEGDVRKTELEAERERRKKLQKQLQFLGYYNLRVCI